METIIPKEPRKKATPITITKETMDIILKSHADNLSDCISVYMFLVYTSNWQHNNQAFCTNQYIATGLNITIKRVIKANKILKELGLIEHIKKAKGKGKGSENYVKVNYQMSTHNLELIDGVVLDGVNLDTVYNDTQIPLTNNKIPCTSNEIPYNISSDNDLNGSSLTLAKTASSLLGTSEDILKAEDSNINISEPSIYDTISATGNSNDMFSEPTVSNNVSESVSDGTSEICRVSAQSQRLEKRLEAVLNDPWYIQQKLQRQAVINY